MMTCSYKGVGFPNDFAILDCFRIIGVKYSFSNCSAVIVIEVGILPNSALSILSQDNESLDNGSR